MTGVFGAMAEGHERGRPGWPADPIAGLLERFEARIALRAGRAAARRRAA
jgi:hypothetical protein